MEISKSPSTGASSDGPSSPPGGVTLGGASRMLDFEMSPVYKQRYLAHIQLHREANPIDGLRRNVKEALRRTIRHQIEADSSVTACSLDRTFHDAIRH